MPYIGSYPPPAPELYVGKSMIFTLNCCLFTLSTLCIFFSRHFFSSFFLKTEVSFRQTEAICMDCQIMLSRENKKKKLFFFLSYYSLKTGIDILFVSICIKYQILFYEKQREKNITNLLFAELAKRVFIRANKKLYLYLRICYIHHTEYRGFHIIRE